MSYTVLARKYRPRNFEQVVGQEHAVRALTNALDSARLHHAYLLTGTRGVGKTTIARILANCFNCEVGKSSQPCGECSVCEDFATGNFLDLYEVDAASRTGVEDTRQLLENVQFPPTSGKVKVYLIDEVHMLSTSSFNALLLTLEEPPEYVKFILATTDPKKVPVTVLSRCLQFHLKNIPPDVIAGQLKYVLAEEDVSTDEESVRLISRAADGSMRDALSLTDQAIAHGGGELVDAHVREMLGAARNEDILHMLEHLANESRSELIDFLMELGTRAVNYPDMLSNLLRAIHSLALSHASNAEPEAELAPYKDRLKPEWLQLAYQILLLSNRDMKYAPDPRTGFEMGMIRLLDFSPVSERHDTSFSDAGTKSNVDPREKDIESPKRSTAQTSDRAYSRETRQSPETDSSQIHERSSPPPSKIDISADPSREQGPQSLRWSQLLKDLRPTPDLEFILQHAELLSFEAPELQLRFPRELESVVDTRQMQEIEEAFGRNLKRVINVQVDFGAIVNATPADLAARKHETLKKLNVEMDSLRQRKQDASREIEQDRLFQQLRKEFNAEVESIEITDDDRAKPISKTETRMP